MTCDKLIFSLFGITTYLVTVAVAHEAIVGGTLAGNNQFPYQVTVRIPSEGHTCGGGIIRDRFILTAAHCFTYPNGEFRVHDVTVIAGTNDLEQTGLPAISADGERIYVPREFNSTLEVPIADIAVLKLKQSLKLHRHRNLVHLELPNEAHNPAATATIAGWGWTWIRRTHGGNIDTLLRFAEAHIIRQGQPGWNHLADPDRHICAKVIQSTHPRGVCIGDGGGPLVENGLTVIGILSKIPPGCSEKIKSGLYTRVAHYRTFIDNAIHNRNDPAHTRTLELHL